MASEWDDLTVAEVLQGEREYFEDKAFDQALRQRPKGHSLADEETTDGE